MVIAIIAILAAVLFPVFAKARERAKSSNCISNLKQIGTAMTMYSDDNDDVLPKATALRSSTPTLPTALPNVLDSYLKADEVFRCPSDSNNRRFASPQFPDYWPATLWKTYGLSYSYRSADPNAAAPATADPMRPYWRGGRRRQEFRDPAAVGVTSDTNPWHLTKNYDVTDMEAMKQAAFNVQFLDGHVRQLFAADQAVAMGPFP